MTALLSGIGLALPAGLNAYIPLLVLALAARLDLVRLAAPYDRLASPRVIALLVVLLAIEFVADKVPLVDHANDLIQTAIRPTSGALLMLASTGTVQQINPTLAIVLGIVAAGSVHVVKSSARPVVTVSTAGMGNPVVSTLEDIVSLGASVIALAFPLLVLVLLVALLAGFVLLLRHRKGFIWFGDRKNIDTT